MYDGKTCCSRIRAVPIFRVYLQKVVVGTRDYPENIVSLFNELNTVSLLTNQWKDLCNVVMKRHYILEKAAQRLALPAAGGMRLALETDKTESHEKGQFSGENPAVRVHALLGSF